MLKVVKLDIPGNGSYTQMTPQFIEVKQCGGGCHSQSQSCVSTSSTTRLIPVLLSSCRLSAGLCAKSCATMEIEEDTACQCDCLQEQKICHRARHSFNRQECRCECREEEEYTMCRDQGRVWDTEECVCRCPMETVKPCSTGLKFDIGTCSCTAEVATNILNIATDESERVERSGTANIVEERFGEMIIMVTLAGIAMVFFIIIINLLHIIKTLKGTITSFKGNIFCKDSDQMNLVNNSH